MKTTVKLGNEDVITIDTEIRYEVCRVYTFFVSIYKCNFRKEDSKLKPQTRQTEEKWEQEPSNQSMR